MAFTPEELAEMARADAEIEESFCISNEDIAFSRAMDREAVLEGMDSRQRKIAESKRQYYAANKDKIAESKRAIQDARKRLGLTQRQFGALFGVKQCTVSFWENISAPENWREIVSVALGHGGEQRC
jgi:DNA-binding transcriptional regulator YiaG